MANSLEALDAEAAPVSVDALVTMDKTAKQGLESKAFSPKPETEWSVNIMPAAAAKPVVELVPLTISTFKKADNTSVEQTSIETQAPLVASESPAVAETTSVGAAETKAVTSSAPAAIDEKQTIEAQQPSSVSAAPPAIAIETEIAAALPVPMAVSKPLATMPIEPTPVVSIPNAPVIVQNKTAIVPDAPALAPNPLLELAPLQKPIALPNTPVPTSLTASSLPVTPDVIAPSTKAEQPKTVLAPPDVVLADTPPVSLTTASAVAIPSAPDTVISSEAVLLLPAMPMQTMASNDQKMPARSAGPAASDRKAEHTSAKDTDPTPNDPMAPTEAPLLPVMLSTPMTAAAASIVQNSGDIKADGEMKPVSDEGKATARAAKRGDWKKPVFSLPPSPNTPIVKSVNAPSAPAAVETPQPLRTAGTLSGDQPSETNSGEAPPSNRLPIDASSPDPHQGRGDQDGRQMAGDAADGRFDRLADGAMAPVHHASFNETLTNAVSNLSSSTMAMPNGLPADVTIESISIQSQGKADEKTHSAADSALQTTLAAPTLSVCADTDHSSGIIVDTSTFRPNASASTTLLPPTNGSAATSTALRADNPGFIAQRDRAMEQQIIAALRGGHDEIRLALYPAQLGQVTINMALDGQKVRIGMNTTNREASTILLGERQSLATSLGHEGFTLDGFDVTDDQPREQSPKDQTIHHSPAAVQSASENSFSLDITI